MNTLKAKLEALVGRVEQLPDYTVFEMASFTQCVFGQLNEKPHKELVCIKKNLGCVPLETCNIEMVDRSGIHWYSFPMCHDAQTRFGAPIWSDEDWSVIRLFTAAIGFGYIERDEWIQLAREQLDKMA